MVSPELIRRGIVVDGCLVGCRQVTRTRRKTTEGLFGFRRIMEAEFMGMFLPVFGSMLQRVVRTWSD